jgi:hypothetical protein
MPVRRPSSTTATQPQRERHWVQKSGVRVVVGMTGSGA